MPSDPAETAKAMARGVREAMAADVGLAAVDAPSDAGEKPRGAVFIGLALGEKTETRQVNLPGDRVRIRQYAVISMLDFLRRRLGGSNPAEL